MTAFAGTHILNIEDKDFKATITNMFKDLEEIILKKLKEAVVSVTHQIESIFKEIEMIFFKKGPNADGTSKAQANT